MKITLTYPQPEENLSVAISVSGNEISLYRFEETVKIMKELLDQKYLKTIENTKINIKVEN